MPRRQTPWSPQRGDWRLRLSWPGTPAASFRWGRVVTINVDPRGAASSARRDAPAVVLSLLARGQPTLGSVASAPRPRPMTPCTQTGEQRVVENAPQSVSTALRLQTARFQVRRRASGHPSPSGSRYRRRHSTRPGACRPGRGHSTPSGTAIPSPNAQDVPGRTEMSPHRRQKRPGRCAPPALTGWVDAPIPAARRARRGPPGAPGYGHRPAPARCAGGP